MKKRLLLKLGLVALLGAGLFVAWLWWTVPRTGICRYTANQVKEGMTLNDVEAIIGLPPGDYCTKPWRLMNYYARKFWCSDDGLILVTLDEDGLVTSTEFISDKQDALLDRVRRFLHLD